ncbi:hypothetical protein BS17DRAFT_580969 [Gyrodon lividus]|nr:hypothetical protein BS17DRAFT_580969 [Gyrodon lividus]
MCVKGNVFVSPLLRSTVMNMFSSFHAHVQYAISSLKFNQVMVMQPLLLQYEFVFTVRLDVNQSIYETCEERACTSGILHVSNYVIFGAPAVHFKDLWGAWVDQTVNQGIHRKYDQ